MVEYKKSTFISTLRYRTPLYFYFNEMFFAHHKKHTKTVIPTAKILTIYTSRKTNKPNRPKINKRNKHGHKVWQTNQLFLNP